MFDAKCLFHRKPLLDATTMPAALRSLIFDRNGSGYKKFIQLRLYPAKVRIRIMLSRIAATNPSTDKTTPNMQAGPTYNKAAVIEHLQKSPSWRRRHMTESHAIIKRSHGNCALSPHFTHNLGYSSREAITRTRSLAPVSAVGRSPAPKPWTLYRGKFRQ